MSRATIAVVLAGAALAGCAIPEAAYAPSPDAARTLADVDADPLHPTDADPDAPPGTDPMQELVISRSALAVPEGGSAQLLVSLRYDPRSSVVVAVGGSQPDAIAVSPAELVFDADTYSVPQPVTATAPVDLDDTDETSTLSLTGARALPVQLIATVDDATQVARWGFPGAYPETLPVVAGRVLAYRISAASLARLVSFHARVADGTGKLTLALYADNGNQQPGARVANAAMLLPKVVAAGVNDVVHGANPELAAPTYWLAVRFSNNTLLAASTAATTGLRCHADFLIPNIDDAWPTDFGPATCFADRLPNLWLTTAHQP